MSDDEVFATPYDCILAAIELGDNVILHGPGGCGKTHTTARLIADLLKKDPSRNIACTALTGVAAATLRSKVPVETRTLHSWAGVGLADRSADRLCKKVFRNMDARERWQQTDILFIDEVSMLGKELFEKLDYVACQLRTVTKPFGGLQLVVSGDFLQLPPVNDEWVFKSRKWKALDFVPYIFEEGVGKRYDDSEYFAMLLRARVGKLSPDDIARLDARVAALQQFDAEGAEQLIEPTLLFATNRETNLYNTHQLEKLAAPPRTYRAHDALPPQHSSKVYKDQLEQTIPAELTFKVGAQVMLRANLSVAEGLTNGSRGVVTDMSAEWVEVLFLSGRRVKIAPYCWTHERLRRKREAHDPAPGAPDDDLKTETVASRSQIPLILAWAFTIHKSQSCTLNCVKASLGGSLFADGQGYVALSRVVGYKGLYLREFMPEKIVANAEAVEYSRVLSETTPIEYV